MKPLVSLWIVLFLTIAGCSEPDPPSEQEVPPELSLETAKQALGDMLRDNPQALYGGPRYPPERLAADSTEIYPNGSCRIGAFIVDLNNRTWHIHSNGPGCIWMIDGVFEVVGSQWIAKPTACAIANPGPGKLSD